MITVDNQEYKILSNNQFQNMKTLEKVDGNSISGNIHFGSGNNLNGVSIGNVHREVNYSFCDFSALKSWIGRTVSQTTMLFNKLISEIVKIFNKCISCLCCCKSQKKIVPSDFNSSESRTTKDNAQIL